MVDGKNTQLLLKIRPPNEVEKKIIDQLNEYNYRKEFNLSKQEFDNEPIDSYLLNSKIMEYITKHQIKKEKKNGRKNRLTY